ncbi:hypothetical protein PG994_010190 [Apiospora phragmitis]|uniref:Uncharacterized protein n=1 Tax=Apiospora phragmitis TaxID=2905665 RepID=A0ABR1TP65_9PEZI
MVSSRDPGLVGPKDSSPLFGGPVLMFEGPGQAFLSVGFGYWWLLTGSISFESKSTEGRSYNVYSKEGVEKDDGELEERGSASFFRTSHERNEFFFLLTGKDPRPARPLRYIARRSLNSGLNLVDRKSSNIVNLRFRFITIKIKGSDTLAVVVRKLLRTDRIVLRIVIEERVIFQKNEKKYRFSEPK